LIFELEKETNKNREVEIRELRRVEDKGMIS
jgi:hypothetical protein